MAKSEKAAAYWNPKLSVKKRVADLLARMTLEEKTSQMVNAAPPVERLGIPGYDWWNECLHGVGRAGIATVFPQAIGLAATWNARLVHRMAAATSDEARAKHHEALRQGNRDRYAGLTFWSPNVNIFRDPRWGRGQETYGEDPYLAARMGVAFIRGLQGDDPKVLKVVATAKHFAVHSGPEADRHRFDARVSDRDLRETYLPAFEAAVREARVESIMGAYNRFRGEPCCGSLLLLRRILREEWGFAGHVVSDCGAIDDIFRFHQVVETPEQAAALAVRAGCDLECGNVYAALPNAVKQGLVTEAEIDRSLGRLLDAKFRLGMFDPPEKVPYAQIPITVNDCVKHRRLALETARESIVLLKNDGVLPLKKNVRRIAVVGPNADEVEVLLGNYNGQPSKAVTPLEGLRTRAGEKIEVVYAKGCDVKDPSAVGIGEATMLAAEADVVVAVVGLTPRLEGEEGDSSGDRADLALPGVQENLLRAVHATGTPLVVVLLSGSAVGLGWAKANAATVVAAWYPGEEGGTAIADVLFGDYNPAGRLPVTFYASADDLPPFTEYAMEGRTYRYFRGEPLFPFGWGLSYTKFKYDKLKITPAKAAPGRNVAVSVEVANVGRRAGDEVVQLYVTDPEASVPRPIASLAGFERVHLAPGARKTVRFTLVPEQLSLVTDDGQRKIEPGEWRVAVGGSAPVPGNAQFNGVKGRFEVRG